mgnify:CR=1 FL=1
MSTVTNYLRNRPLTILNLLFLFLIIEYIALGKYSFIQTQDFTDDIFPRYIALWRNFSESGFQHWSSDIGAGTDRLVNHVFYDNLLSLLIAVFPAWLAYQIFILLTTYAGVIGFYKLNTVYFNHPKELSALIAIFIPLIISSVNSTGLSAGIQFYPFTIYCVYWINSRVENPLLKLIFLTGLIYFTSKIIFFQLGFVYLAPFMMLWFGVIGRVKLTTVISVAVAFLVVVIIDHATIIALISSSLESHRVEFSVLQSNEGRSYFVYQLILVLLSIFFIIRKRIVDARLLVILTSFLLITIGDSILNYLWDTIFGRSALASLKISRLTFFSTSLLGFVLLSISNQINHKEKKILSFILCISFILIAVDLKRSNFINWVGQGNYVANFEIESLKNLRASDNHSIFRVAVVQGPTHPNMLAAYGFESADGFTGMYPKSYKHYWAGVISPFLLSGKDKHFARYFLDWGSRFYLFTGRPANGGRYEVVKFRDFFNLNLLSLANVKYIISHQPIIDERLQIVSAGVNVPPFFRDFFNLNLLSLANVKSIILRQPITDERLHTENVGANVAPLVNFDMVKIRLRENFSGRESLFIYKNADYVERVFAINKIRYFDSNEDLLAYANNASVDEMKSTAFVLGKLKEKLSQYDFEHTKASTVITSYSPSKIDFLVRSSGDVMVVLTESFNLNWKCASKGKDLEIVDVYGTFFSVVLGEGENSVSCQYQPKWAYRFSIQ